MSIFTEPLGESTAHALELLLAYDAAAQAGFGFRQGTSFYAIPGQEAAAADYIEAHLAEALAVREDR